MPTLLIVHHTPSPALHAMFDAVRSGAGTDELEDVEVVTRAALTAGPADVLAADAYVLGAPANIGYMAGALKHFFDQVYYPCLEETPRRPYGVYVHGNENTTGAVGAIESIAGALGWRKASETVTVMGQPEQGDLDACWELGATVGASLVMEL
jgi:NAD(P)H-dependent FMN reductase